MSKRQSPSGSNARFALSSERLGLLPLINQFIARIRLDALLERHVPTLDARNAVSHAKALGVLLRLIIVEREPIYRPHQTCADFAPGAFGLSAEQMRHLGDDRIGLPPSTIPSTD
jgi:hypothetical protein